MEYFNFYKKKIMAPEAKIASSFPYRKIAVLFGH
jgi:hypothetical protein